MRLIKFLILGCLFFGATSAWAIAGDTDGAFGLDGNVRMFLLGAKTDEVSQGFGQGSLRFVAEGKPVSWLSYEVHGVTDFAITTAVYPPQAGRLRNRTVDTRHQWMDDANIRGVGFIDRASFKIKHDKFDLTVGRQAITLGTAYFWNPLDVFRPFGATQFDRDYKGGVDAIRGDIPLGDFSGLTVVGVLGRGDEDQRWPRSTALIRGYTTIEGWDATAQAGKIFGGYQVGAGFVGDVKGIEIRSEASWFKPLEDDSLPEHVMAVIGTGYRFENTLYLSAEYLYNGAVLTDELQDNELGLAMLMLEGRLLHRSGHLVGAVAQYELMPILNGSVATLYSLSDDSYLIQPGLSLSISDESDVVAGAMITQGDDGTEFGSFPSMGYLQMKSYF